MGIESEERLLELNKLVLSQIAVVQPSNGQVEKPDEHEGPLGAGTVPQPLVLPVDEFHEPFSVGLVEGMVWEIFGDLPWVRDAVVADEVHSVVVGPDFGITNLVVAFRDFM